MPAAVLVKNTPSSRPRTNDNKEDIAEASRRSPSPNPPTHRQASQLVSQSDDASSSSPQKKAAVTAHFFEVVNESSQASQEELDGDTSHRDADAIRRIVLAAVGNNAGREWGPLAERSSPRSSTIFESSSAESSLQNNLQPQKRQVESSLSDIGAPPKRTRRDSPVVDRPENGVNPPMPSDAFLNDVPFAARHDASALVETMQRFHPLWNSEAILKHLVFDGLTSEDSQSKSAEAEETPIAAEDLVFFTVPVGLAQTRPSMDVQSQASTLPEAVYYCWTVAKLERFWHTLQEHCNSAAGIVLGIDTMAHTTPTHSSIATDASKNGSLDRHSVPSSDATITAFLRIFCMLPLSQQAVQLIFEQLRYLQVIHDTTTLTELAFSPNPYVL